MGQEEVSVIMKSFEDICNLFSNENHEKDIQISRKELVMKTNGKKRMFALLVCVMMIVSSMSVWAGYASETIGGATHDDQALCELYLSSSRGQAFTTPNSNLLPVTTYLIVYDSAQNDFDASGTSVATVSKKNLIFAYSEHSAGPYSTTLSI